MNTLSTAVEELNWVLSAGTSCSTRAWVERLDSALESIGQAIGLHGDPLEPLERVDPSVGGQVPSPTTDRQVGRLHSELTGLLHDLSDLRARLLLALEACLEDDPAPGDFDGLRDRAAAIRDALDRYGHAEARLLQESATTDIGSGD